MSSKTFLRLVVLFLAATTAHAETATDVSQPITIDGNLRAYYFTRHYGNDAKPNQTAFSLGGRINVTTSEFFPHIKAVASLYFAQSLGLNRSNPKRVDNTLPGFNIITLGQSYLQYQDKIFTFKAGRQLIDTPWLDTSDSRIIPVTYQGFYAEFNPTPNLKLTGLRVFKFKNQTAKDFSNTGPYKIKTRGALGFGVQHKLGNLATEVWYYRFYDLANLFYTSAKYEFNNIGDIKPIIGVQFMREWGEGKNLLKSNSDGAVNATGYGVLIGAKNDTTQLTVGYNFFPVNKNAFQKGNMLSPYTDPLYTSSMIAGLIDKGAAGSAVKITGTHFMLDKQLKLSASYAKYFTEPHRPNTSEIDFDATYSFSGKFKGLSVRYRVGILEGDKKTGQFIYNRLMLQYNF